MATNSLEERMTALEAEVHQLKGILQANRARSGWKKLVGAFLNDPYFEKAMKYGRQYRESLRPNRTHKRHSKHGNS